MRILTILLLALSMALAGCSGLAPKDETANWNASELYEEAKLALKDGNYERARDLFGKLEARYPYGRYAEQAQLETLYAHYKAEEPDAAIAAAERFIKLHPRHPNVDYAYYMRGLASYNEDDGLFSSILPSDPTKTDPGTARESFRFFKELITRFPSSRYAPDALQRMTHLRNNLAQHEVNVADYYLRRAAHLAAANRAKYVLENYERTPAVPAALTIMVKAYRAMGMDDLAADAQRVLALNYPELAAGLAAEPVAGDNTP
jgi:outer membrane protein assembly factor BamD